MESTSITKDSPPRAQRHSQLPNYAITKLLNFLDLFSRLAQSHIYIHLLFASVHGHPNRISRPMIIHNLGKSLLIFYPLAIDRDDQITTNRDWNIPQHRSFVTAPQTCAIGSSTGYDLHDQQAVVGGKTHFVSQFRINRDSPDSQSWAPHPPQRDQVI